MLSSSICIICRFFFFCCTNAWSCPILFSVISMTAVISFCSNLNNKQPKNNTVFNEWYIVHDLISLPTTIECFLNVTKC